MKVLLIMNHAPDYRESFLRLLAHKVTLTVVAQPCLPDRLTPPCSREGYQYMEIPSRRLAGLRWQDKISKRLNFDGYDIICCNFNPRQPQWIITFMRDSKLRRKWIWWGPVYGRSRSLPLRLLKQMVLPRAAGCLVYSDQIVQRLKMDYGIEAISFNNTEVSASEFRQGVYNVHPGLRLLFVGRWQQRKRLERLVLLAERRQDIHVRLVGPDMDKVVVTKPIESSDRFAIVGKTTGKELYRHFDWADLVVNPGHAGLLVMNAARHGKGIVIDADSEHAPEHWLAQEAGQPFVSFDNQPEVDQILDMVIADRSLCRRWGRQLQEKAKEKYTIEHMAATHHACFRSVLGI